MLWLTVVKEIFTVAEVAEVLLSLEKTFALTPRGIRYYDRTGMVSPTGGRVKVTTRARATRLYTVADIALLRLVCRLHRRGIHERALWGLLVYRQHELRRLIACGHGELVIDTPAALAFVSTDKRTPAPIRIDVAKLLGRLTGRLAAHRRRRPWIWTGLARVPVAEIDIAA